MAPTAALSAAPSPATASFTSLGEYWATSQPALTASAMAIAEAAGLTRDRWALGWQSAGRTPEPWAGPDILDELRNLAENDEVDGVLVVPQGFTSDHLEVAFDLDIEASRLADSLGLAFARTSVVNDDAVVMAELAQLIYEQTPERGVPSSALET